MEQKYPIIVSKEVYQKLPGVMLITGVAKVNSENIKQEAVKEYLNSSWKSLQAKVADETSVEFKQIQQWCDTLKVSGISVKDYPPSIKAISKRALKGGEVFSINPIVDAYNAISMDLALPFGAYDKAELVGSLQIRLSSGNEDFIGLGSEKNESTESGEIVFADERSILTRMFLWRQSGKCKITSQTTEFVFICEVAGVMGLETAKRAQEYIEQKLIYLLGAEIVNMQIQTESNLNSI